MRNRKGQYTLEWATLIGFIGAALGILYPLLLNCKSGELRDNAEQMGEPFNGTGTTMTTSQSQYTENINGQIQRNLNQNQSVVTTGGG
jgi:hypothetical protein